jgi:hypothetical protein
MTDDGDLYAIDLASRFVLDEENKLVSKFPSHEIKVVDMIEISEKGIEVLNSIKSRSISPAKLNILRNLSEVEDLIEQNLEVKNHIFGNKPKSCALHLFLNCVPR